MENEMVTRKQAEAVLALVQAKYRHWLKTWPVVDGHMDFDAKLVDVPESEQPKIVEWEVREGETQLAIVWESNAPDSWAMEPLTDNSVDPEFGFAVEGAKGSMPAGVRAEPFYSFVLVLYKEV
jgi:hypothetical protein